jgi:hypothetical protein
MPLYGRYERSFFEISVPVLYGTSIPAPEVYVIAVSVIMFSVMRLCSFVCRVSLGWCASAWIPIAVVDIGQLVSYITSRPDGTCVACGLYPRLLTAYSDGI